MNITNLKAALPYLMKSKIVPYIWGNAGIGKTQVVKQAASELGYKFVYLTFGAVEDVGDIIGLQEFVRNADGEPVSVKHVAPDWFPREERTIIFIDEFNRAPKSVIQAMLPFILEGKLHTHQLPDDCHIIVAGNPPTDDYITNDVSDKALQSRTCHLLLEPSKEEFLQFCTDTGVSHDITSFISENPELLEVPGSVFTIDFTKPSRRAYKDFVAPFLALYPPKEIVQEVLKGLIGLSATTKLLNHIKSNKLKLKGKDVLRGYTADIAVKVKENRYNNLDVLSIVGEEIVREIKKEKGITQAEANNVAAFLLDIPVELGYSLTRQILMMGFDSVNKTLGANAELIKIFKDKIETVK